MKKIIYTLIAIFLSTSFFAQQGFNYKTIIKNNDVIFANQTLNIRFTIYSTDPNDGGTQLYQETHTTTTNTNGIAIVKMGEGNTMDMWADISWDANNYYKTEYNLGSGYVDMGTQRFDFVPAAEWARQADYATYVNHVTFASIEYKPSTLAGYGITDADPSTTNELQNLSISGDQLSISNGNTVVLPTGTTYTAGTGIGISGGVISNTGDTNAADDFDGNYYSLSNTPIQFLNAGGDEPTSISEDVHRMSGVVLGYNQVQKGKLDIRVNGANTNIPENVGIGIANFSTTSTTQKGVDIALTGNSTAEQFGVFNELTGTSSFNQTGTSNKLSGNGTGPHTGTYNYLLNSGTGIQTGVRNDIATTNDNWHYGVFNQLTGTGTGQHLGTYNRLGGSGTGIQYGNYNEIVNTSNNLHIGNYNYLYGIGTGAHYGNRNLLSGAGTGVQYGTDTYINNSNNTMHYGVYNELDGAGGGTHYGVVNQLSGAGTGSQYGMSNTIDNSGNGNHYAVRNDMSGFGSGVHAAMFSTLSGSGSGYQYGVKSEITNTSTGHHYGFNAILSGSGNGNKYGSYNLINPAAGGTHYAVYGSATKLGSYAGYFEGDVRVSKKILSEDSGNADMKAYIYGKIDTSATGAIVTSASSDGFSIVRNSAGNYTVNFVNPPGTTVAYTVIATMDNENIGFISVKNYNSYFQVYTYSTDEAGIAADRDFTFVVYKK